MINIFADVLVALIDYITGDFAKGHPCPFFIALLISIYIVYFINIENNLKERDILMTLLLREQVIDVLIYLCPLNNGQIFLYLFTV